MVGTFHRHLADWAVAIAAISTAAGVVYVKILRPVWRFGAKIGDWMDEVHQAVDWVHHQMRPNNGTSLVDKVDWLVQKEKAREAGAPQLDEG